MDSQSQSPFFKLPAELRCQIYTECFSSVARHVIIKDGELQTAPCVVHHDGRMDDRCNELWNIFQSGPAVQRHQTWYDRMTSEWCNHWRCEEALRSTTARPSYSVYLWMLLCCKRFYEEARPIFYSETSVIVVGKEATEALFGLRNTGIACRQARELVSMAVTIDISLRRGGPDLLFQTGPSLWMALSSARLPRLKRIHLWIDGWDPVSRRLYPAFRTVWERIPREVAEKLTVSFPCGEDGAWAWDEVPCKSSFHADILELDNVGKYLPRFDPIFQVVWRGWEEFTATSAGYIRHNTVTGMGGPGNRFELDYNPFEQLSLYGRRYFDSHYP